MSLPNLLVSGTYGRLVHVRQDLLRSKDLDSSAIVSRSALEKERPSGVHKDAESFCYDIIDQTSSVSCVYVPAQYAEKCFRF